MEMTNPAAWAHLGGPPAYPFEDMVDNGEAVSVSTAARQHFGCPVTVAIEASAYDRFVCWDSAATRRLGLTTHGVGALRQPAGGQLHRSFRLRRHLRLPSDRQSRA